MEYMVLIERYRRSSYRPLDPVQKEERAKGSGTSLDCPSPGISVKRMYPVGLAAQLSVRLLALELFALEFLLIGGLNCFENL